MAPHDLSVCVPINPLLVVQEVCIHSEGSFYRAVVHNVPHDLHFVIAEAVHLLCLVKVIVVAPGEK